jgi:WD40 repeat protein
LNVAIDGSGTFLAAADDRTLRIWNLTNVIGVRGDGNNQLPVHFEFNPPAALPNEIFCIAFSPKAKRPQVAVGCRSGDVRLFRIANLLPNGVQPDAIKIVGHRGPVNCVKYNPDGSLLATAGDNACIRLWDPNGKEVRLIGPFRGPVNGLAFSPDGSLLASAHGDSTVKIWDTRNWGEPKVLADHTGPVMGVDISSNGRYLASCSRDLWVIVYDLYPGTPSRGKKGRGK